MPLKSVPPLVITSLRCGESSRVLEPVTPQPNSVSGAVVLWNRETREKTVNPPFLILWIIIFNCYGKWKAFPYQISQTEIIKCLLITITGFGPRDASQQYCCILGDMIRVKGLLCNHNKSVTTSLTLRFHTETNNSIHFRIPYGTETER